MKTVSSTKDRNGVDIKYSPVDGECSQDNSSETLPAQGLNESDNLIICDSQLASSFQEVKLSRNRLKPGHYLQKVFLYKLKSQSVPSLDKSKINNNVQETEVNDSSNTKLPASLLCETNGLESIDKEANGWYKTWPECGIDKPKNGVAPDSVGPQDSKNNSSSNGHDRLSITVEVPQAGKSVCDNVNLIKRNTAIPLDNLLDNLPIAYSPITKQIHLINSGDSFDNVVNRTITVEECDVKCLDSDPTIQRINTEVSSFSSTVSSLSDVSPSTNGDSALGSLFDNGDSCSLLSLGNCSIVSDDSGACKSKRKGISGFFSRGVFAWKGRSESGDSWSLFGKGSDSDGSRPSSGLSEDRRSLGSDSVLGSTGLIQLERPAWLPAKPKQEHRAHSQEHEKILQTIRKRELKEAKHRKKLLQNQLKAEDELANATRVWLQEILPKWPQMRSHKKTLDLWWQGVPPCVRGRLWRLAIGNDLNITHDLYEICVQRAQERLQSACGSTETLDEPATIDSDRESSMELIQLDISRTFPHLCIFQKKGPYYEMLHSLLAAYACYRPDVGYVQGMSFIAAVFILNMDPPDAFVCFANLLNRPCHRAFYSLDQCLMEGYYATYRDLLKENLPKLCDHLELCHLSPDLYLLDWVYTVFAKAMNIDLASRVWDVFLRDGDEFIFRTAIGVLKVCEETLMTMDFLNGSQYLTRLPDLCPTKLFSAISSVRMSIGKQSFSTILQSYTHTTS